MIDFNCPDCKTLIERPDADAGRTLFCPKCYFTLIVPQKTSTAVQSKNVQIQNCAGQNVATVNAFDDEFVIICPACQKPTDNFKTIEFTNTVLLPGWIVWKNETLLGCSGCVRSMILSRILYAIPATHLAFPLYGFIYLLKWVEAGAKGHNDPAVAHAHRMTRSQYLDLPPVERPDRGIAYWLTVLILLLLVAGLGFLIFTGLRRW